MLAVLLAAAALRQGADGQGAGSPPPRLIDADGGVVTDSDAVAALTNPDLQARVDAPDGGVAVAQAEPGLRVGVPVPDGTFFVAIAFVSPTHPRQPGGYLAFWQDENTGDIFVYDRLLMTEKDIGHGLLNLAADMSMDPFVIAGAMPALIRGLNAAVEEDVDPTPWQPATFGRLRELIGAGRGHHSRPKPNPPETALCRNSYCYRQH